MTNSTYGGLNVGQCEGSASCASGMNEERIAWHFADGTDADGWNGVPDVSLSLDGASCSGWLIESSLSFSADPVTTVVTAAFERRYLWAQGVPPYDGDRCDIHESPFSQPLSNLTTAHLTGCETRSLIVANR